MPLKARLLSMKAWLRGPFVGKRCILTGLPNHGLKRLQKHVQVSMIKTIGVNKACKLKFYHLIRLLDVHSTARFPYNPLHLLCTYNSSFKQWRKQ